MGGGGVPVRIGRTPDKLIAWDGGAPDQSRTRRVRSGEGIIHQGRLADDRSSDRESAG